MGGSHPKFESSRPTCASQAPGTKTSIDESAGRTGERTVRCYKCNEIGHISSECRIRQNTLADTSKGKSVVAESEVESNSEGIDDVEYDDSDEGIMGDGA